VYYIPYMILKNQLIDKRKAKLIIEGVEVYVEMGPQKNAWVIKARIYYPPEIQTPSLQEHLNSLNYVNISEGYLKAYPEEGFVVLSQETREFLSFLLFKSRMQEFMKTYDFWKSIVDDMIKNERALSR
jgi:hypothetical protein